MNNRITASILKITYCTIVCSLVALIIYFSYVVNHWTPKQRKEIYSRLYVKEELITKDVVGLPRSCKQHLCLAVPKQKPPYWDYFHTQDEFVFALQQKNAEGEFINSWRLINTDISARTMLVILDYIEN